MPRISTKDTHELLNERWLLSLHLRDMVGKKYPCSKVKASFGNFVSVGRKLQKAEYPLPVFTTKEVEVGITLNEIYTTYILEMKNLDYRFINDLKKLKGVQVYGWKNFLDNLFDEKTRGGLTQSIDKYKKQSKYFQLSFDYSLDEKRKLLSDYAKVIKLAKQYNIKIKNQMRNELRYYG